LFAKDPVQGKVKTRLEPCLGTDRILDLYRAFLADSLEKICSVEGVDRFVEVASAPESGFFFAWENDPRIRRIGVQEGRDLGERMRRAFEKYFAAGYETVVLVGSDSPSLPRAYIEEAFRVSAGLTLGPSTDGGYYLIGMAGSLAEVFDGVPWGTGVVLDETLARVRTRGIGLHLLPVWYDVDQPADLRFLKTHLNAQALAGGEDEAPATRDVLFQIEQL
jgi:rSAM/selenodomain-associated transferase 1